MNKKILALSGVVLAAATIGFFVFNSNSSDKLVTWLRNMPLTYNYAKIDDVGSADVLGLTGATPLTLDENGQLKNYAAKSVDVSSDSTKVTITLKDGLKYSDGSSVKAGDYYQTAKLIADPKVKASYASWVTTWIKGGKSFAEGKSKQISGFKVLSDNKYEINLTGKYGFFKSTLSSEIWAPIPEKSVSKAGGVEKYGQKYDDILSSGEYRISKVLKDQYVDLVKNEKSILGSKNSPNEIRMKYYANQVSWYNDFKAGKINWVEKSESSDKVLGKKSNDRADYRSSSPSMSYVTAGKIDPSTMRALDLALDKNYIVNKFWYNNKVVRNAIAPSGYNTLDSKIKASNSNDYNLEMAKSLVKKKNIELQVYTERTVQQKDMEKYMIGQWAKLGIKTTIIEKPFAVGSKEVFTSADKLRNYDVAIVNWSPDFPEASTFYASILGNTMGTSYAYMKNTDVYDTFIKNATQTSNEELANDNYAKADSYIQNSGKIFTLFQGEDVQYIKKGGYITIKGGRVLKPSMWKQN